MPYHIMFSTRLFFLMIRRPPRSTRTAHSFPTRLSSDLSFTSHFASVPSSIVGERAGIWIVLLMGGRPLILSGVGAMRFVSALWPERSRPSLARPRIIGHISPHWFTANHMGSARTCETEGQMVVTP